MPEENSLACLLKRQACACFGRTAVGHNRDRPSREVLCTSFGVNWTNEINLEAENTNEH